MYIQVITIDIRLKITKHAKIQMIYRGITIDQIKKTIKWGAKIKQTDGYLSTYTYIMVAWKKEGEYYKIKTVMIKD